MYRAAPVKSNAKFSRFVSSVAICHPQCEYYYLRCYRFQAKAINEECVIWYIQTAYQHINILSFSNLCFIHNQKNLSKSNSQICSSFLYANLATLARAAVSESNTFPVVANRDFKEGWFSL